MRKDDYCKVFGRDIAIAGAEDFLKNPEDYHRVWANVVHHYTHMSGHQLAINGKHWGNKRAHKAIAKNKDWSPYTKAHQQITEKSAKETFKMLEALMLTALDHKTIL